MSLSIIQIYLQFANLPIKLHSTHLIIAKKRLCRKLLQISSHCRQKKSDDIDDAVAPILEFQFLPFQELILFTLHFTSEPSRVNELEVGLSGHLIAYSVVDIAALSIISR